MHHREKLENTFSVHGFALGYLSGAILAVVAVVIQFVVTNEDNNRLGDRLCLLLTGLWWFGFSLYTFKYLKTRPGPPLPQNENVLTTGYEFNLIFMVFSYHL